MDDSTLDALAVSLRARLLVDHDAGVGSVGAEIDALIAREAGLLDAGTQRRLARRMHQHSFGFGPLDPLLADETVEEIMVNGPDRVFVARFGQLESVDARFRGEDELRHTIERILAPLGRRVDEATPFCDARLPDGSRVNVIIAPLSLDGPVLTIRRFRPRGFSCADLVAHGTWTQSTADFLAAAVRDRRSILVCGGTGSGKTTTLNVLSSFIDPRERIVTIEDAAELALQQEHVVRLESRPPTLEGRGEVTMRALVRNALRMRPDRIIVGEVRGPEALDMVTAMSSGHDGSLGTVHAGSAAQALRRIETLALMAELGLPHGAVRAQIVDAIDLVVCQMRRPDGTRRVQEVVAVSRGEEGQTVLTPCLDETADDGNDRPGESMSR